MPAVHPLSSISMSASSSSNAEPAPVATASKSGPPVASVELVKMEHTTNAGAADESHNADDAEKGELTNSKVAPATKGDATDKEPEQHESAAAEDEERECGCCSPSCCLYNGWSSLPRVNPCCATEERPLCMKGESCTERLFEGIGVEVAKRPWVSILVTIFLIIACASGYAQVESENRPDKLWIPTGSPALFHKEYVQEAWPSQQRIALWIATCRDADGNECNILEAKYLQELARIDEKIRAIEVDTSYAMEVAGVPEDTDNSYSANYTFSGDDDRNVDRLCFPLGALGVCGESSVLSTFRNDVPEDLTNRGALDTINFYANGQQRFCPLTISDPESPCRNATATNPFANEDACQVNEGDDAVQCRGAFYSYCNDKCPNWLSINSTLREMDCTEETCLRSAWYLVNTNEVPVFTSDLASLMSSGTGGPTYADNNVDVVGAEALFGFFMLATETVVFDGTEVDPVAEEWEKAALCVMGITAEPDDPVYNTSTCEAHASDLLLFTAQFQRSLGDEFGSEILGDLPLIGGSFAIVIVYLLIMLSRRDYVHSMLGMSIVCILTVGLSYAGCIGLGTYIGWKDNNLNLNIPFLLLGLGVDDAFVISSEFFRAKELYPKMTVQQRTVYAAKYGGVSVLITSFTDALAFLVGSSTVLPALSWFCAFSGVGIIMCFVLQIFVFLPALQINAMRAENDYYDLWCCCKSKRRHEYTKPLGCCGCCKTEWCPPGVLGRLMRAFGQGITSVVGAVLTLLVFAGLLAGGIYGSTQLYKDFQLEWFVPEGSYLKDFYSLNEQYFAAGVSFTVYTKDLDYFDYQSNFAQLHYRMMHVEDYIDTAAGLTDWHHGFMSEAMVDTDNWPLMDCFTTEDNQPLDALSNATAHDPEHHYCVFKERSQFYAAMMTWFEDTAGWNLLSNNVKWIDGACEDCIGDCRNETHPGCDYDAGFNASTVGGTLTLNSTDGGQTRYDTMTNLRAMVAEVFPSFDEDGVQIEGGTGIYNDAELAFPYAREFENWEEVGTIDSELWKNLAICFGVIVVIVFVLIPKPLVAMWVILSIVMSIVDILGFLHFWGITISGVSTIFILISVGLAVDYSAHIAHMFVESQGTSRERAVLSLERIGPSVFNAVFSTLLAVIVLASSSSYIYVVFFKVLCLTVVFAGAHGLWFLPTILSLAGGSAAHHGESDEHGEGDKKEVDEAEQVETGKADAGNDKEEDVAVVKTANEQQQDGAAPPREGEEVERSTYSL